MGCSMHDIWKDPNTYTILWRWDVPLPSNSCMQPGIQHIGQISTAKTGSKTPCKHKLVLK
jgi:hypothetical protein